MTGKEFVLLPERPETGKRYELRDGEAIVVLPSRPLTVQVTDLSGSRVYASGDNLPLRLLGNATLAVDRIFLA